MPVETEAHKEPQGPERWVTVKVVYGLAEAQIVKGYLESHDLLVHLDYEALGKIYGFTVDGLGQVRIQVPESQVDEALELLAEVEEP